MEEINARLLAQRTHEEPTQLYSRRTRRAITPVIGPTLQETTQVIVSLPATSIKITTATLPIMEKSIIVATTATTKSIFITSLPEVVTASTLPPMTHSIEFGNMGHQFDLSELFAETIHETGEESTAREVDPREARISSLESQEGNGNSNVTQKDEHMLLVDIVTKLLNQLGSQGETSKKAEEEASHHVDLTGDKDPDKDPSVGPSGGAGGETQAVLATLSVTPAAQGESIQKEGNSGGSDKGKSMAEIEEGKIELGDEWDEEGDDVVIEFPKGDGEGVYELEDGEIFEAPAIPEPAETEVALVVLRARWRRSSWRFLKRLKITRAVVKGESVEASFGDRHSGLC
ncbi:hypothetical protein L1987_01759 [Smallanthus sonchifolius]|uniref:Uncharacterized protein n=1 Tax=Smallanthus sonchifolius TaxID=185202 RepID=A0ACB9K614_9ASTR|nr:hypothetical protein L1987_01759 [Smallanthus sonchifolius]